MTSHRYKRCKHCQAVFVYQSSGQPVNFDSDQSDSSTYCKSCWAAVCEALSAIPVRAEKFYVDVDDPTERNAVFDKEKYDRENPKRLFGDKGPIVCEVGGSLFKMAGNKVTATMHQTIVYVDRVRYMIERWSDDSKPVKIVRTMERDLKTKSEKPWIEYHG